MCAAEMIKLEKLNQIQLTDAERAEVLELFGELFSGLQELNKYDTSSVERMVHVMPINNVFREDAVVHQFSREQLQQDAPDTDEGYWCVPKVIE